MSSARTQYTDPKWGLNLGFPVQTPVHWLSDHCASLLAHCTLLYSQWFFFSSALWNTFLCKCGSSKESSCGHHQRNFIASGKQLEISLPIIGTEMQSWKQSLVLSSKFFKSHFESTTIYIIFLMFQDILTDFTVDAETIPIEGGDTNWFGHKVYWFVSKFVTKLSSQSKIIICCKPQANIMDLFFFFISGYDKGCLIPQEETGGWSSWKSFQFWSSKKFCWFLISDSQIFFGQISLNKV